MGAEAEVFVCSKRLCTAIAEESGLCWEHELMERAAGADRLHAPAAGESLCQRCGAPYRYPLPAPGVRCACMFLRTELVQILAIRLGEPHPAGVENLLRLTAREVAAMPSSCQGSHHISGTPGHCYCRRIADLATALEGAA